MQKVLRTYKNKLKNIYLIHKIKKRVLDSFFIYSIFITGLLPQITPKQYKLWLNHKR